MTELFHFLCTSTEAPLLALIKCLQSGFNPSGTKSFGTHTKHQGEGVEMDPPIYLKNDKRYKPESLGGVRGISSRSQKISSWHNNLCLVTMATAQTPSVFCHLLTKRHLKTAKFQMLPELTQAKNTKPSEIIALSSLIPKI